jgi:uncharacterized protein DUF3551
MMTRIIFAAVAVLAGVAFGPGPAKAYEAPWCAVTSKGNGNAYWDCQYGSIDACRPNVIGADRGWCNPNPNFVGYPAEHRSSAKRRYRL